MPLINVFESDWRECLKAHYQHVVEEQDVENERSLITVLHDSGFEDDEIQAMRRDIVGQNEALRESEIVQAEEIDETDPEQPEYVEAVVMIDSAESISAPTPPIDSVEINAAEVTPDASPMNPANSDRQPSTKPGARKKPKQLSMF